MQERDISMRFLESSEIKEMHTLIHFQIPKGPTLNTEKGSDSTLIWDRKGIRLYTNLG